MMLSFELRHLGTFLEGSCSDTGNFISVRGSVGAQRPATATLATKKMVCLGFLPMSQAESPTIVLHTSDAMEIVLTSHAVLGRKACRGTMRKHAAIRAVARSAHR
jgi:hypothetical protein